MREETKKKEQNIGNINFTRNITKSDRSFNVNPESWREFGGGLASKFLNWYRGHLL